MVIDRKEFLVHIKVMPLMSSFMKRVWWIFLWAEFRKFTRADQGDNKMSRLDRFLVSESFIDMFPDLHCLAKERRWSDHCPILSLEDVLEYGPISFELFNSWIMMDGFVGDCSLSV